MFGFGKKKMAFNALDLAATSLRNFGLDPNGSDLKFSVYEDQDVLRGNSLAVIVGMGKNAAGELVGFAIEVNSAGAVDQHRFSKPGHASLHKMASVEAKTQGVSLMNLLKEADRRNQDRQAT